MLESIKMNGDGVKAVRIPKVKQTSLTHQNNF